MEGNQLGLTKSKQKPLQMIFIFTHKKRINTELLLSRHRKCWNVYEINRKESNLFTKKIKEIFFSGTFTLTQSSQKYIRNDQIQSSGSKDKQTKCSVN